MTDESPIIVRASYLTGYSDCGRRTAARMLYVEIEAAGFRLKPQTQGIAAAIGSGVHAGAALALTEKAKTGILPPVNVCQDAAVDSVKKTADSGVIYDKDSPGLGQACDQATRMARLYHADIAPLIDPIIVEVRLEAEVAPGVILSGQPDQVAREPGAIVDLKTGKALGNHNPQIGSYSLLARTNGIDIKKARIDFIPRVSLKKPQPPAQRRELDIATVETAASNVLRHFQDDLKVFREGDPQRGVLPGDPWSFPANPNSKLCSEKYCSAFGTDFCHEHAPIEQTEDDDA